MHYDGLLRVPMIFRGPGIRRGVAIDEPVSTLDLGPTFYDCCGAKAMQRQHGESLKSFIEQATGSREFALNEWELLPTRTGVALSLRTVRTKTHKMTVDMLSGAGELYDMQKDPDETMNLFDDPAASETKKLLTSYMEMRPNDISPNSIQIGMA